MATSDCNEVVETRWPTAQSLPYASGDNTAAASSRALWRAKTQHLINHIAHVLDSWLLRCLLSLSAFTISSLLVYGISCSGAPVSISELREEFVDTLRHGSSTAVHQTVVSEELVDTLLHGRSTVVSRTIVSTTYTGASLAELSRMVENIETRQDQVEASARLLDELSAADTPERAELLRDLVRQCWLFHELDSITAVVRIGSESMSNGDYEAAEACFLEAIRRDPLYSEAWNKLATVHYIMHKYDASLAESETTLSLEPRHFGAMMNRARIFFELRAYDEAAEEFRDVHELIPALDCFSKDIDHAEALQSKKFVVGDS